jgi:hypothetical protein
LPDESIAVVPFISSSFQWRTGPAPNGTQVEFEQRWPALHCAELVQLTPQVAPLQAYGEQSRVVAARQTPLPSHVRVCDSIPAAHAAAAHVTPIP